MITGAQIRAARALLKWSARELGEKSGISLNTVQRLEAVDDIPSTTVKTIDAIQTALEKAGVEFVENGVILPARSGIMRVGDPLAQMIVTKKEK